jgi:hypothetical protein
MTSKGDIMEGAFTSATTLSPSWLLRVAAIFATAGFVAILGPGITL